MVRIENSKNDIICNKYSICSCARDFRGLIVVGISWLRPIAAFALRGYSQGRSGDGERAHRTDAKAKARFIAGSKMKPARTPGYPLEEMNHEAHSYRPGCGHHSIEFR